MLKIMKKDIEYYIYENHKKLDKNKWAKLALTYILPFKIIRDFNEEFDYFVWHCIGATQPLTIEVIHQFKANLSMYDLIKNENIPTSTIIKISDDNLGEYLGFRNDISKEIIDEYKDTLNWFDLLKNNNYSEEFIREYVDYIDWTSLCSYYKLSDKFLRDFQSKLDWELATIHQNIPEDILRNNSYRFTGRLWEHISKNQNLSESFIEDFSELLNWNLITKHQNLSLNFLMKHKDKIAWVNIHLNPFIDKTFIDFLNPNNNLDFKKEKLLNKLSRPYTDIDKKKEEILSKF